MNKAQDYDDNHLPPTESDDESSRCMNTAPNVSMTATLPTIAQGQKPLTANEMLRMPRPTPWPAEGCRRDAPELLIPSPGRPRRVSVRPEGCRHMLPRDPSPPGLGRIGVRSLGSWPRPTHRAQRPPTSEAPQPPARRGLCTETGHGPALGSMRDETTSRRRPAELKAPRCDPDWTAAHGSAPSVFFPGNAWRQKQKTGSPGKTAPSRRFTDPALLGEGAQGEQSG